MDGYNKGTSNNTDMSAFPTITLQDIKRHGARAIPDAHVVYLIVNSKTKAVLVPPREYEMLLGALEDLEDIAAIEARKNEPLIPFEKVFPSKKKKK